MTDDRDTQQRYVYFYINQEKSEKLRKTVPAHVHYWKTLNLEGYLGGPFGDQTGGLISFLATSLHEATEIILQDPFLLEKLVKQKWIKEWVIE